MEAHGTGTTLGDPIEAQALLATYGQDRPADRPLWLGSVKSNIGHTQAAAGVAGVIKMVLAMRHGVLPRDPARGRAVAAGGLVARRGGLLTEARPWPETGRPRRAAVSVVRRQRHQRARDPGAGRAGTRGARPAAVRKRAGARGAVRRKSGQALTRAGRARWRPAWNGLTQLDPLDVGYSLVARTSFPHRAVLVGRDRRGLGSGLRALAGGLPAAGAATGVADMDGGGGGAVFVFPGQGAQWVGMGADLLDSAPVFAAQMAECAAALASTSTGPCWTCCEALTARRHSTGSTWCSRCCSRSWCRWPRCGVRTGSSRPRWWATRRGRSRPLTWPVRCRWTTPCGSSSRAAG